MSVTGGAVDEIQALKREVFQLELGRQDMLQRVYETNSVNAELLRKEQERTQELEAAILVHRQQEPNCRCGFEIVLPSNPPQSDASGESK
jgi:hypothetical protein